DLADHRQRARRADRIFCVLQRPGPLRHDRHHLRRRRLRPEVRRRRHDRSRLDPVRGSARRRLVLAGAEPSLGRLLGPAPGAGSGRRHAGARARLATRRAADARRGGIWTSGPGPLPLLKPRALAGEKRGASPFTPALMLFTLITLAWLAIATIIIGACRMAARADSIASARASERDARPPQR